jgi:hypothetical protein
MICHECGIEAETRYVSFHQNIGVLVLRFSNSIEGRLCKACIHKHFWSTTSITFFLGWWGMISFVITPFFLLNNIGRYLFCLGMSPPAPGAQRPELTDAVVEKIVPHVKDLFERLNDGQDFTRTVTTIAELAGVTPGQVDLFIRAVMLANRADVPSESENQM